MRNRKPEVEGAAAISRKNKRKEVAKFKLPGIWVSADIGGSLGREKDLGGDKVRTVREGSFILGSQTGSIYSMAVSGDYIGNSKTS